MKPLLAAATLLLCVASVRGDCRSVLRDVSEGAVDRAADAVAWSGTALGVAKVTTDNARAVFFATYAADLTPLTSDRIVVSASFIGVTSLLWNGSEFGLFYLSPSRQLMLQRVSADGQPIGSAVAIAPNHSSSNEREYDVIWDATRRAYVLATSVLSGVDVGVWIAIIEPDGTTRSELLLTPIAGVGASPRVAAANNGMLLVLFRRGVVFQSMTVDAAGLTGTVIPVLAAKDAHVTSSGTSFAVVGSDATLKWIHWAVLDDRGTVVVADSKLFSAKGAEAMPVSIVWNATLGEWAVSYLDSLYGFAKIAGDYRLRHVRPNGTLISDSTFSPDLLFAKLASDHSFVWTGSSYVSAASQLPTGRPPESYLIRHCPLAASILMASNYVHVGEVVTFTAAISGGGADLSYGWDLGDGSRQEGSATIAHRYEHLGEVTVTLQVSDSTGATSTGSATLHVIIPRRRAVHR